MKIIPYKQHNHIGYCVYFLYDKNEIVYIGYTFNLGKRLGEHSQWINSRENHRNQLVKKQLKAYKEHNKQMRNAFRQINKICKKFNINRVELLRAIL